MTPHICPYMLCMYFVSIQNTDIICASGRLKSWHNDCLLNIWHSINIENIKCWQPVSSLRASITERIPCNDVVMYKRLTRRCSHRTQFDGQSHACADKHNGQYDYRSKVKEFSALNKCHTWGIRLLCLGTGSNMIKNNLKMLIRPVLMLVKRIQLTYIYLKLNKNLHNSHIIHTRIVLPSPPVLGL